MGYRILILVSDLGHVGSGSLLRIFSDIKALWMGIALYGIVDFLG